MTLKNVPWTNQY